MRSQRKGEKFAEKSIVAGRAPERARIKLVCTPIDMSGLSVGVKIVQRLPGFSFPQSAGRSKVTATTVN